MRSATAEAIVQLQWVTRYSTKIQKVEDPSESTKRYFHSDQKVFLVAQRHYIVFAEMCSI